MRSAKLSFSIFSKSPVTAAAALFVLLVCLLLVAITAWSAWNTRVVRLSQLETATENMARSFAQHADDAFKAADTSLLGLVERIAHDGTSPEVLLRLHKLMVLQVSELPQLKGLFIYDKDGRWLVNSRPALDAAGNNADREYFIFHRNNPDPGPHIGVPVRSRSTNEWIIPLSRRMNDANGQFAGVVLATIGVDYFIEFYDSYNVGNDGAILLALNNGIQLVRWPLQPDSIGKDLADGPLFALFSSRESGNAVIKSPVDGIERLNGYRRLDHYPVVVMAALSKHELLADWRQATLIHGTIAAAIVAVLALLGYRLVSQIILRDRAEEEARRTGKALLKLNQTLEKLALLDGLTGLANRRHFDAVLQDELSRAARAASSLALVMIDIDCFKQYNDLYGHLAGDECLRQVSTVIKSAENRPGDLAARYGGEEFVLLLPTTDVAGALHVAEKIRNAIRELDIRHEYNESNFVTISAGVSALTPATDADTASTLIGTADEALYMAKSMGRDRVQAYSLKVVWQ